MKKIMKIFSFVLCIALVAPTISLIADANQIPAQNEMKDICLVSTDDYYIIVSVPEDEAESYQKRLETEDEYREKEIQEALSNTSFVGRALPPGNIEYQSLLYKSDIKKAVDSYSGSGTFDRWMTGLGWVVSTADISGLIQLTNYQNIFILSASILGTLAQWAQEEREEWWNEAYRDIINGKITAVRYTIVQNTAEYPKVWRIFERI